MSSQSAYISNLAPLSTIIQTVFQWRVVFTDAFLHNLWYWYEVKIWQRCECDRRRQAVRAKKRWILGGAVVCLVVLFTVIIVTLIVLLVTTRTSADHPSCPTTSHGLCSQQSVDRTVAFLSLMRSAWHASRGQAWDERRTCLTSWTLSALDTALLE